MAIEIDPQFKGQVTRSRIRKRIGGRIRPYRSVGRRDSTLPTGPRRFANAHEPSPLDSGEFGITPPRCRWQVVEKLQSLGRTDEAKSAVVQTQAVDKTAPSFRMSRSLKRSSNKQRPKSSTCSALSAKRGKRKRWSGRSPLPPTGARATGTSNKAQLARQTRSITWVWRPTVEWEIPEAEAMHRKALGGDSKVHERLRR